MKVARALIAIGTLLLLGSRPVLALDPSLNISQYAHTAWTTRDGFSVSAIFAMAQTPDGYLWLGSEFGLFRFDGVHAVHWQPPAGQHFYDKPYALLVTRDGTLWIGTFAGLVSWDGSKLTHYSELEKAFVTSLLEDSEGTVWVGTLFDSPPTRAGRLCAIRSGHAQCYGDDGAFGSFVWSLGKDSSGTLWVGAETGLWRWKPGPPKRYATPGARIGDMTNSPEGRLIFGISGAGLKQMVSDKLEPYPIQSATNRNALLPDRDINSNKLLRDRDGGLWIGTHDRGLIHIHNGRTDVFTKSDGLSGDISCSLFEDHEGNVWFASSRGLDRFRQLPVTTISKKEGLSSDVAMSLLARTDGNIWVGTQDGLTTWKNGQTTIFHKGNGLPDDAVGSLFQDYRGRIWATFKGHGLSYFNDGKFIAANAAIPSAEVYSITGDNTGNLWLSGNRALSHIRDGRLVDNFPWSALGRQQQAKVVLFDHKRGGVWLAFWLDGGVLYFKDGQIRASYTAADGLGKGPVGGIQLDRDGALWAAIQEGGGLSRIKDGRIATLTTKNGLPCDTIHWSIEDDDRSLWLYTACGLVRIARSEVDTWIADPKHRVETTVWDATDGVTLRSNSPAYYNPPVAKSTDGRLWFITGEGVQVIDPHHLPFNKVPPPVHIDQIAADNKMYWQNLPGRRVSNLRLPPRTRDLQIDYTALSLVAPEKIHFKYMLEGQDRDWKEVVNDRQAQYTNLPPRHYRFRVIASNNSGVWNEQGDAFEFSVVPAYYQTNWFRALCLAVVLALLWAAYQLRVRQLHHEFDMTLEARVGERTRIARELHDTLLQSFHGILLHLQTVSNELPGGQAKQKLDGVIDQAAQAIVEGRDAVQGLRASTIEGNDLALAIRTLGEELAATGSGPRRPHFTVQVEGTPRNLHPIVRDEVYRIAGEGLRNAFRHAAAQRIEVEIHYDNRQLRARVRDDGKGIDPQHLSDDGRERHFGLRGMRERAKLIGGNLTVWSERDSGTEVELSIPGEHAYATAAERRRSWLVDKFARKFSRKDTELKS
jgi:signal transduction histidine kinase/ligand-binding sensor domain-containing protein